MERHWGKRLAIRIAISLAINSLLFVALTNMGREPEIAGGIAAASAVLAGAR